MADVEELLEGAAVRLAPAQAVRARGDRRRRRRRAGGVCVVTLAVAAAVGIGWWPGSAREPGDAEVASGPANPFKSGGAVRAPDPSDLPGYGALRWKAAEERGSSDPLPRAGLNGVCTGWTGTVGPPGQQYTVLYDGRGDAVARYRVSEYANRAQATDATHALGRTLEDCGLRKDADGHYSGAPSGDGGVRMVGGVRRWGAWVGVMEEQYDPSLTD